MPSRPVASLAVSSRLSSVSSPRLFVIRKVKPLMNCSSDSTRNGMDRENQLGRVLRDPDAAQLAYIVVTERVRPVPDGVLMHDGGIHVDRLVLLKLSGLIASGKHVELATHGQRRAQERGPEVAS